MPTLFYGYLRTLDGLVLQKIEKSNAVARLQVRSGTAGLCAKDTREANRRGTGRWPRKLHGCVICSVIRSRRPVQLLTLCLEAGLILLAACGYMWFLASHVRNAERTASRRQWPPTRAVL